MGGQNEDPGLPPGRISVPKHVVRRTFGGETVVLNLETGQYHGLNETAGMMLDAIEATGDARRALERLASELTAPVDRIKSDLASLCARLAERGIIEIDGGT